MAEILKKTGQKIKKAGHTVEEKAGAAGHKVVDGAKSAGHKTKEGAKAAGHKTAKAGVHAVGRMDFTCDTCGKLMKPGGEYTRTIRGKEYQFCSVPCSNRFHPKM